MPEVYPSSRFNDLWALNKLIEYDSRKKSRGRLYEGWDFKLSNPSPPYPQRLCSEPFAKSCIICLARSTKMIWNGKNKCLYLPDQQNKRSVWKVLILFNNF